MYHNLVLNMTWNLNVLTETRVLLGSRDLVGATSVYVRIHTHKVAYPRCSSEVIIKKPFGKVPLSYTNYCQHIPIDMSPTIPCCQRMSV